MHTGTKGEQGFQQIIKKEDIKKVLKKAGKSLKNSQVLSQLKKLDPATYETISFNGVKRVLLEMGGAGEIAGGKDKDLGLYLWEYKKEK